MYRTLLHVTIKARNRKNTGQIFSSPLQLSTKPVGVLENYERFTVERLTIQYR